MDSKALGKGLSALIPETPKTDVQKMAASVSMMKTANIRPNSLQPRTQYDEEKLEELKASIKEQGVLQPILIRQKNDAYEVVAGERRLRAAKALGLEEVPVIVKELDDRDTLVIALIENIQREDLNPIEEAESFKKLIEDFQYTHDEVAKVLGKNRSTITNIMRLLNLPRRIQQSVSDGEISMGHARALLGVESFDAQNRLFEEIISKEISVRELENHIK
ncbi:MAG: ParB/RepB/Spo0J family partition protein, partial [Candidatus Omnitrophica bacterium]|nr:ParB/RepB/Spo0J family partition protein [Candidatus Omnitrophota bacterium]